MPDSITDRGILWLKLDAASQEALKLAYPPRYLTIYYDHVTLLFDVAREDVTEYVGKNEQVAAYAHSYNDHIEAVRVQSDLPDSYGVPHITLSALPGVHPVESVVMLQNDHTEIPREKPLIITGTIEFVPLPKSARL